MRHLLFTLLMCLTAHSIFAQCNATGSFAMAPQGNNLLRGSFTNTTVPSTGPTRYTVYYVNWGDGTGNQSIGTGTTVYHNYYSMGTIYPHMIMYTYDSTVTGTTMVCSDTLSDTLSVAYSPCATIMTVASLSSQGSFSANTPAGNTGMTYSWNFGDGNTGSGQTTTHTYSAPGTYTVTLTATKSGGCTYTNTQTVNIGNPCNGFHVGFTIVRSGLTHTFNSSSSWGATASIQTLWNFGDGSTSTTYSPTSHTYSTPGVYSVKLKISLYDSLTHVFLCSDSITHLDTVSSGATVNLISGSIMQDSSMTAPHIDSPEYKVWLISYDSAANTLTAVDSTIVYGNNPYYNQYQFNSVAIGTYRVKAQLLNGPTTGTSYVPTYHTSSLMWNTANTIPFTGGTFYNEDILMQTGTAVTGPGFVGGSVTAGANKGTKAGDGVPGINIYLLDANNHLIASAVTNSNGNFVMSGIPTGSYNVYPEDMNFASTPISVTISNGQATALGIDFSRSESHKTITPVSTGILNVTNKIEYAIYPNPAKDKVTIQWNSKVAATADINVTDVTGKKVFSTSTVTDKDTELNLGSLQKGLYFITIQSDNVQSTQKILLQ